MAWVDPEYAGELAVVSAWLAALLPWSVSLSSPAGGSFLSVRFPLVSVRLLFGLEVTGEIPLLFVWNARGLPQPGSVAVLAFTCWLVGAVVLALALLLSALYYIREADLEARAPIDPVRLMGALLTTGGALLLVASVLLALPASALRALRVVPTTAYAGATVPIGALIVPVLGVVLLRVERRTRV